MWFFEVCRGRVKARGEGHQVLMFSQVRVGVGWGFAGLFVGCAKPNARRGGRWVLGSYLSERGMGTLSGICLRIP